MQSKVPKIAASLGWVLLGIHCFFSAFALLDVINSHRAEGWTFIPLMVFNFPLVWFGLKLDILSPFKPVSPLFIWALLSITGAIWNFYWPRIFLVLIKSLRGFWSKVRSQE